MAGVLKAKVSGEWVNISLSGPPGPAGGSPSYVHNQATPMAIWTINHNLGWNPNVTIVDSGQSVVEGDITYLNVNTVRASFSAAFSGMAYLS